MILLGIVLFFVVVIVIVLVITARQIANQRISLHDGRLLVTAPVSGIQQSIPTADIGTAIYIPENDGEMYSRGPFDFGGILLLNTAGKLIRVIQHYPGSSLPLSPIFEQISAAQKLTWVGKQRRDLVKAFPKSLGFWQLRGILFVSFAIAVGILGLIFAGLIAAVVYFLIFVS